MQRNPTEVALAALWTRYYTGQILAGEYSSGLQEIADKVADKLCHDPHARASHAESMALRARYRELFKRLEEPDRG